MILEAFLVVLFFGRLLCHFLRVAHFRLWRTPLDTSVTAPLARALYWKGFNAFCRQVRDDRNQANQGLIKEEHNEAKPVYGRAEIKEHGIPIKIYYWKRLIGLGSPDDFIPCHTCNPWTRIDLSLPNEFSTSWILRSPRVEVRLGRVDLVKYTNVDTL